MLLFHGLAIFVTALTVVYPGLMSIRAIESEQKDDDKYWLTYWMIFGQLTVYETFLPFLFYFIPYWDFVKIGFFVWLLKFNGCQTMFQGFARPALHRYRPQINEFLAKLQ